MTPSTQQINSPSTLHSLCFLRLTITSLKVCDHVKRNYQGCHRYGVDRFTVKLMISMSYQYANMLNRCAEDHTRLRNALFFLARSFLKKLLMAFLPSQLHAIYVICVYFDQLYSQKVHKIRFPLQTSTKHDVFSPESALSTTSVMRKRCAREIQNGCAHKTVPKTSFFH